MKYAAFRKILHFTVNKSYTAFMKVTYFKQL